MRLEWSLKNFEELSNTELYNILRLRNAIFIIDQQCIFEDIDGKDKDCYHFFGMYNHEVVAYARIVGPGMIYDEPCISRVCTSLVYRGKGLGKELMKNVLAKTAALFPGQPIRIGAQLYLSGFYEEFGFRIAGEVYLEDGIRHIQMLKP